MWRPVRRAARLRLTRGALARATTAAPTSATRFAAYSSSSATSLDDLSGDAVAAYTTPRGRLPVPPYVLAELEERDAETVNASAWVWSWALAWALVERVE